MFFQKPFYLLFDKDGGGGAGSAEDKAGGNAGQEDPGGTPDSDPQSFEDWLGTLPEEQQKTAKKLHSEHEKGLKTALESERESRKDVEGQLRDLAKKAEKGSELQEELNKMADTQASVEQQRDFYEEAHGKGVTNLKLAYTVAVQDELIDKKGRVNWEAFKENYPELFRKDKVLETDAGDGSQNNGAPAKDMNTWIRGRAGR